MQYFPQHSIHKFPSMLTQHDRVEDKVKQEKIIKYVKIQ